MRSGADHRIRNRTRFTTLRMGLDGKVVASGFHLFDLRQAISIVDLNLGNRSVANDVENALRTDRIASPGLLNVILLVELGRPPDLAPAGALLRNHAAVRWLLTSFRGHGPARAFSQRGESSRLSGGRRLEAGG